MLCCYVIECHRKINTHIRQSQLTHNTRFIVYDRTARATTNHADTHTHTHTVRCIQSSAYREYREQRERKPKQNDRKYQFIEIYYYLSRKCYRMPCDDDDE